MRFLSVDSSWLASVFISFLFFLSIFMLVSRWEQNEMNSIYNFRTWSQDESRYMDFWDNGMLPELNN